MTPKPERDGGGAEDSTAGIRTIFWDPRLMYLMT